MINNPYKQKVLDHDYILTDTKKIYSNRWKWSSFFWNENKIVLEIWTWLWNFFSKNSRENLEKNFVWMEIRYKRLYKTAEKTLWNELSYSLQKKDDNIEFNKNFTLLKDFGQNIDKIFSKNEIDETIIFFPDPWEKKDRQRKNRLLQLEFLNNLYEVTKVTWKLLFKTDHREYFDFVLEELKKTKWKIILKTHDYEKDNLRENSETSEFEQIFRWQKLEICYLELEK